MEVSCAPSCKSRTHVLTERYYDGAVIVWAVVSGTHHEVLETLFGPILQYTEFVDNESTFFLQSTKRLSAFEVAALISGDVAEARKEDG